MDSTTSRTVCMHTIKRSLSILQQDISRLQVILPHVFNETSDSHGSGSNSSNRHYEAAASASLAGIIAQISFVTATVLPHIPFSLQHNLHLSLNPNQQALLSPFSLNPYSSSAPNENPCVNPMLAMGGSVAFPSQQPSWAQRQDLNQYNDLKLYENTWKPTGKEDSLSHEGGDGMGAFLGEPVIYSEANTMAGSSDHAVTLRQDEGEQHSPSLGLPFPEEPLAGKVNNSMAVTESENGREEDRATDVVSDHNPADGNYDTVQLDTAELLAEHSHFCNVCGKGFKRDANLRMHMRGHGDEYKSLRALQKNPSTVDVNNSASIAENVSNTASSHPARRIKYSCPSLGCKRNMKHPNFLPLKSVLCVRNHFLRSHCDKSLTCSTCGVKKFSVLSDLRTHQKHCGKVSWMCSCLTSFSRKDKLLGHLALFEGHTPIVPLHEMNAGVHLGLGPKSG